MDSEFVFDGDTLAELLKLQRDRTLAGRRLLDADDNLKAARAEAEAAQAELTRLNGKVREIQTAAALRRAQGAA